MTDFFENFYLDPAGFCFDYLKAVAVFVDLVYYFAVAAVVLVPVAVFVALFLKTYLWL